MLPAVTPEPRPVRRRAVGALRLGLLAALAAALMAVPALVGPAPAGATAVAGSGSAKVRTVPDSIASDCSEDVTYSLAAFIAKSRKGSTVELARDGCYQVDGPLRIQGKKELTIDGRGATLQATTPGDKTRRHVWIQGGRDITIRDLVVRGAHPNAGPDGYTAAKAFQHGFALQGVNGALLENVEVHDVYGDLVYIGSQDRDKRWSKNVTITGSRLDGSGRQGIAIVAGKHIVIDDNYIGRSGQSLIDLEANTRGGGAVDVQITGNTTGTARHFWLANKGAGLKIKDIVVKKNTMEEPTAGLVFVYGPLGGYRGPFVFADNDFQITGRVQDEGSKGAFFLSRAEDVTIRGNRVTLPRGRNMPAVENRDSLDVTIKGNQFKNAGQELIVSHRRQPTTTTEPATETTDATDATDAAQ